jgi:hypothetical protein
VAENSRPSAEPVLEPGDAADSKSQLLRRVLDLTIERIRSRQDFTQEKVPDLEKLVDAGKFVKPEAVEAAIRPKEVE